MLAICKWDELSSFADMQVAQFVSLFWYCWNSEDWQSAGKKLQVLGSGVAAINYVAQVLTPITLCCHSLGEMTLMSLSHECNCRMPFTLHSNPRKKNGLTCLIKLWSGSHKTLANALWKHQNQGAWLLLTSEWCIHLTLVTSEERQTSEILT